MFLSNDAVLDTAVTPLRCLQAPTEPPPRVLEMGWVGLSSTGGKHTLWETGFAGRHPADSESKGKPVQIRRGAAAVIGEARFTTSLPGRDERGRMRVGSGMD